MILVTAFDPFAGRAENNSANVARALVELLGERASFLELPTKYDLGAEAVLEHIQSLPEPPEMVISLGEASLHVQLETAAHNRDGAGIPDNAGVTREGTPIAEAGPPSIGLRLPVHTLYAAVPPEHREHFVISTSPGAFVCNNTAYHLGRVFADTDIVYGFVHVPAASLPPELPVLDPATIARILADGIEQLDLASAFTWPTDRDGALALLADLAGSDAEDFARGLLAAYDTAIAGGAGNKDTALS